MTLKNELNFKDITLDDKDTINKYLRQSPRLCSDLTFTNLFMWRKSYNIRFAEADGVLFVSHRHGDTAAAVTPVFCENESFKAAVESRIGKAPFKIYGESELELILNAFPDTFEITEDRDSFDYVYGVRDLTELSGKAYHSKKNHINKFCSLYNYRYEHMTPEYRSRCTRLFEGWYRTKAETVEGADEQLEAVLELLENWEQLDIVGGCITVDENMVAFSFGEKLCSDPSCAVIHLEHADTAYRGSYAMINRLFLQHEFRDLEYVNREEDMGLEGLRRAKLSYKPAFMVKKYTAVRK